MKPKRAHSIPSWFKEHEKRGIAPVGLFPFSYETPEMKMPYFVVGKTKIRPKNLRTSSLHKNTEGVDGSLSYDQMKNYPLLLTSTGVLITGPQTRRYHEKKRQRHKIGSVLGKMGLKIDNYPDRTFIISDTNSDAVLEPAHLPEFLSGHDERGFTEYGIYNAETRQQRLKLLMAIGSIASMCGPSLGETSGTL